MLKEPRFWAAIAFGIIAGMPSDAFSERIDSYAFVKDDGSLEIENHRIHLYGIDIPPTNRTCRTFEQPVKCGSRASLALDFKIGSNFVDCETVEEYADGSITAICRVDGEDLGAWMLTQGWARALPNAPSAYAALEQMARGRGMGIWGFQIDRIQKPPR